MYADGLRAGARPGVRYHARFWDGSAVPLALGSDDTTFFGPAPVGPGEDPATTSVFIPKFDFVGSAFDYLAQFLTVKEHVAWGLLW